jgi:hypothetical protein
MTEAQAAWLAGLFDGEGCISFAGINSATLHIGMTDRDLIDRVRELTGTGYVYVSQPKCQNHKAQWHWHVTDSASVRELLSVMLPWFGARRSAKAMQALERLNHVRKRGFCKRGHPMAGENLYLAPCGLRQCRACAKIRELARKPTEQRRIYDRKRDEDPVRRERKRVAMRRYIERQQLVKT